MLLLFSACRKYKTLRESWRKITGYGPSTGNGKYNCDTPRNGGGGIKEGWHRFSGPAGTHLPTNRLNSGKEIEIIQRLFLVIAMCCQAGSSHVPLALSAVASKPNSLISKSNFHFWIHLGNLTWKKEKRSITNKPINTEVDIMNYEFLRTAVVRQSWGLMTEI